MLGVSWLHISRAAKPIRSRSRQTCRSLLKSVRYLALANFANIMQHGIFLLHAHLVNHHACPFRYICLLVGAVDEKSKGTGRPAMIHGDGLVLLYPHPRIYCMARKIAHRLGWVSKPISSTARKAQTPSHVSVKLFDEILPTPLFSLSTPYAMEKIDSKSSQGVYYVACFTAHEHPI